MFFVSRNILFMVNFLEFGVGIIEIFGFEGIIINFGLIRGLVWYGLDLNDGERDIWCKFLWY